MFCPFAHKVKNGFTLAEVLLTLLIIGIICALVIPVLYNSINDKINASVLKKTVSVITESAKEVITDDGASDALTEFSNGEEIINEDKRGFYYTIAGVKTSNANQGAQYFLNKYFKHTSTDCGTGKTNSCVGTSYATANAKDLGSIPNNFYCIKSVNGVAICMRFDEETPSGGDENTPKTGVMKVIVDTNAKRPPNMTGRDTFVMKITNDGFLQDIDTDRTHCNIASGKESGILDYGAGCFSKVVDQGWKISK